MSLPSWRRHDSGGLVPRALRIRGIVRWRLEELKAHINAGAPDRATWERMPESRPWTGCPK
jgi:hypothetical protein